MLRHPSRFGDQFLGLSLEVVADGVEVIGQVLVQETNLPDVTGQADEPGVDPVRQAGYGIGDLPGVVLSPFLGSLLEALLGPASRMPPVDVQCLALHGVDVCVVAVIEGDQVGSGSVGDDLEHLVD